MEEPTGKRPNTSLSGQRFWCLQQVLLRWRVAHCLLAPLWWCTSEMCSWDNNVNYLVHHHPTWGDEKTLHHLWNKKCSKSTQMMKHAVQGVATRSTSHNAHTKSSPHSPVYEGTHMCDTAPLELLHDATVSRECCHSNHHRCPLELHFSQPVLSS